MTQMYNVQQVNRDHLFTSSTTSALTQFTVGTSRLGEALVEVILAVRLAVLHVALDGEADVAVGAHQTARVPARVPLILILTELEDEAIEDDALAAAASRQ